MLDQMDEEFGIGNLVKEEVHNDMKNAYTDKDLKGLKVEHNLVCIYIFKYNMFICKFTNSLII
jgi:hypothetical protein